MTTTQAGADPTETVEAPCGAVTTLSDLDTHLAHCKHSPCGELDVLDIETTPCGDQIRASAFDDHVNDCEACADIALDEEAFDAVWANLTRR